MNIACSIDNNYVEHCCVMLCSFFINNSNEKHTVYLLSESLNPENREILEQLVTSYGGTFFYCSVSSESLKNCLIRQTDYLTIATYYRLFMADLLPQDVHKIIYLDCDIVVNSSLEEMWNTNIDNYALAAIEEMGWHYEDTFSRLEFDEKYGYFNAGVMLINLDYWRKNNLTSLFLDYQSKHTAKIKAHDQDILNALLYDKCLHISCKWNVETGFIMYEFIKSQNFNPDLLKILRNPVIIHYTWFPKPWEGHSKHPFRIIYYNYLERLPIKKQFRKRISFEKRLRLYWYMYHFCLLLFFSIKQRKLYKM